MDFITCGALLVAQFGLEAGSNIAIIRIFPTPCEPCQRHLLNCCCEKEKEERKEKCQTISCEQTLKTLKKSLPLISKLGAISDTTCTNYIACQTSTLLSLQIAANQVVFLNYTEHAHALRCNYMCLLLFFYGRILLDQKLLLAANV